MNEKPKISKWPGSIRRVLFPLACLVTIIALFYAEEDWRGWHEWHQFQQKWVAKGEHFDWTSVVPPPVPDDQNFALAPVVFTSYGWLLNRDGRRLVPANTNIVNRLAMDYSPGVNSPPDLKGDWTRGIKTDFSALQHFYRTLAAKTNLFPVPVPSQSPAADVLVSLSRFAPTIEDLRQAAQRPYSRFPLNYGAADPADILLPHLSGIKQTGEVVQLRALAELQTGDTGGALADIMLLQRLVDSVRNEPFMISHLVRMNLVRRMLQPVWEGLADHRWTDAQLAALDAGLAKFDFLADYQMVMQSETGIQTDFIGYVRAHPEEYDRQVEAAGDASSELSVPGMLLRWHLFPSGWFYQNQLLCARATEEDYLPIADAEARTFAPAIARQASANVAARQKRLTPYNMIERQVAIVPGNFALRCAFTQSSVDLAHVAIALERYRRATGKFPDGLAALEPQFLNAVPHDIIGGQPLHYRLTDDGQFVLYSVGWNGIDDGGVVALTKGSVPTLDMRQGDWVWSYEPR